MPGFDALAVRDLVALVVIATRTLREGIADNAEHLVTNAFEVADEFVSRSEGQWANGARANHVAKAEKRKTDHPT